MNWLKSNKAAAGFIASGAVVLAILAGIQGCDLDRLIPVNNVPLQAQRIAGVGQTTTLADAPAILDQWDASNEAERTRFVQEINRAARWRDFRKAGLNLGLTAGEGAIAGLPGGGLITSLLFGAGGLLLRKPGDGKLIKTLESDALGQATAALEKLADEKRASFNKGVKVGSGTGGGA